MRISKPIVAALVAGLLVGGAAGAIAGVQLGTNAIVSHWVTTNANNTEETVRILELLHGDREPQALSALETHLNRHAFGLMPSSWERAGISERARARGRGDAAHPRLPRGIPLPGEDRPRSRSRAFPGAPVTPTGERRARRRCRARRP